MTAEQIRNEAFIMPAKGCDRDLHRWLHEQGGSVRTRFELEDDHAIMAMVQKGLGISILPGTILNALPEGLAVRPLAPQAYRTIGLAAISWKKGSPAARRAISFIKSTFCMEEDHTP
ncbi:LysR substrate binding domain protein [compost metagenome]